MFRQVKSPAYGTGIATNLVSDEERQRYNYGGRVGLWKGSNRGADSYLSTYTIDPQDNRLGLYYDRNAPFLKTPWKYTGHTIGKGKPEYNYDLTYEMEEGVPSDTSGMPWNIEGMSDMPYKIGSYGGKGKKEDIVARGYVGQGEVDISDMTLDEARKIGREDDWWRMEKGDVYFADENTKVQPDLSDQEKIIAMKAYETEPDEKFISNEINPNEETLQAGKDFPRPDIKDTDTLDISALVDKYYDKKKALGEGQLGLAGAAIKAGFQKPSDAAATVGDALGKFGTTVAADEKALKKAAMTGEIYNEIYKQRAIKKGEEDRKTAKYKADIKEIDETEDSDDKKYLAYKGAFFKTFEREPTGNEHKQIISNFNAELAKKSIVLSPQKQGTGKKAQTVLSPTDQNKFTQADEGTPIIIGGQLFVKDSTVPGGMREVSTIEELITTEQVEQPSEGSKILTAAGV